MNKFKFGFAITKIDEEEQMVYGYASTPDLDSQGEIIKLSALEKALPGYLKFPTIREMHQAKAVGTTKEAKVDSKGLYIGAKVVDKSAWELVKEGVYKAFSIGGDVVKRTGKVISELDLIEISLVDVPANKAAVIEVWKRGELSKDAETAYSMANLMIQIKETVYYYDYLGKDTKKLKKILALVKDLVIQEAGEEEREDQDIERAKTALTLEALQNMSFEKGSLEEALRKGVILGMNKTVIKAEDQDDPKKDETVEEKEETTEEETVENEEETTEETEEEETKETESEEKEGEESEEETEETPSEEEETKETSESDPTLLKIEEASKKLDDLTPKVEKKENVTLAKSVDAIADSIGKMVSVVTELTKRVAELEKTPAAPKSKSAVVYKSGEEKPAETIKESSDLVIKNARLEELGKLFDSLGANEFAKRGYSVEATHLKNEIARLQA